MEQKQIGAGLLLVGIIGVVFAMMMDTSVSTSYGQINNLGLMKDQQNYLIIAGLAVVAGLALILIGGGEESSDSGLLRACPSCAEKIQPLAIKCRFCGTDVEPIQSGSNVGSVDGLSSADLKNLAEFYSIREASGEFEYQGERYSSLADAVTAARVGSDG